MVEKIGRHDARPATIGERTVLHATRQMPAPQVIRTTSRSSAGAQSGGRQAARPAVASRQLLGHLSVERSTLSGERFFSAASMQSTAKGREFRASQALSPGLSTLN